MSLPDWLDPLYTADEMRAADAYAIEQVGVPSLDLMERAGAALARAVAGTVRRGPIRVVIGKGNNGGDGLVAARLLRAEGREVDVLSLGPVDELRGDAAVNLSRLPGPPPAAFDTTLLAGAGAIVDAMLGTGFRGTAREPVAGAIDAINDAHAPVVACDVPSGVNASTGEVDGSAVYADVTVTFHGSKIGLHIAPGAFHSGSVDVAAIGIPESAPTGTEAGLISGRVLELVPHRTREGSKFTSGTVLIAAGSRGLTGAPTMVALAASRTGAGYVQVAVPASVEQALELRLLEQMTLAMPDEGGTHTEAGVAELVERAARAEAVVLGPGLGRTDDARAFARGSARALEKPLLIDADALNAHVGAVDTLASRGASTVLTPHAGELARLLETDSDEVAAHRLSSARAVARRSGAVVLLKGDDTIVAEPGGCVAINAGGTPALATAGTGDVLSGVIGALLCKRMDPFAAAAAGALAHARAGRHAAARQGADHTVAGDVIDALPDGFRRTP